jgi:hypothetical protein
MVPNFYYRVHDSSSRASWTKTGFKAEDTHTYVDFDYLSDWLSDVLDEHLDWASSTPSSLISAYSDERTAMREARRRVEAGKWDVVIAVIDIREWERNRPVTFRKVRDLAEELGLEIPHKAWNNSKYEYVFWHEIPDSMIVDKIDDFERV